MPSPGDSLLQPALIAAELRMVLKRAAERWQPEKPQRWRPTCGLCVNERAWISSAPPLDGLPHSVTHALVQHVSAALDAAEFEAGVYVSEDVTMHG